MRLVEHAQPNLRVLRDQSVDQVATFPDVLRVERRPNSKLVIAYFSCSTNRRGRLRHHASRVCQEEPPFGRQLHLAAVPTEQGKPQSPLQFADSGGERRLGNVEELRCPGEGHLIRDGDKDTVGSRVQIHKSRLGCPARKTAHFEPDGRDQSLRKFEDLQKSKRTVTRMPC